MHLLTFKRRYAGVIAFFLGTSAVFAAPYTYRVPVPGLTVQSKLAYTLDADAAPASTYVGTGPWNTNPFGMWVWNTPGFVTNAATSTIVMESLATNNGESPVSVYIDVSVDDVLGGIKLNGQVLPGTSGISGWSPVTTRGPFQLLPGTSLLKVQATNQGGPAGLQVRVRTTTGQVLNSTAANPWFSSNSAF